MALSSVQLACIHNTLNHLPFSSTDLPLVGVYQRRHRSPTREFGSYTSAVSPCISDLDSLGHILEADMEQGGYHDRTLEVREVVRALIVLLWRALDLAQAIS